MEILALSDIHGKYRALEVLLKKLESRLPELVLIAGDITAYSGYGYDKVLNTLGRFKELGCEVIFVPGNVDDKVAIEYAKEVGIKVLHKELTKVGKYYIIGIGGGIGFSFPAQNIFRSLTDNDLEKFVNEVTSRYDLASLESLILVTHTPPYNTKVDIIYEGGHVGSKAIRKFIETYKPILHICGHIHESRGIDKIGNTYIVNPGPLMRGYYSVINIDEYGNVIPRLHSLT